MRGNVARIVLALGLTFVPSVAAESRKEALPRDGFAEVTFEKGYAKAFGTGASQSYFSSSDDICTSVTGLAGFHAFSGKRKVKFIRAGEEVKLFSVINYINSNFENKFGKHYCMNKIKFTPKSGERYRIIQTSDARNCQISITELGTGSVMVEAEAVDPKVCWK